MNRDKLFNITDAHKAMTNLSQEMADRWTRVANLEYQKMKKVGNIESFARRRAINKANEEIRRKYGKPE